MSSQAPDVVKSQFNRSQFSRSQFIRAGAGAGKTTKLITSFMEFVKEFKLANKRYPRVVMTTFTRKATQEVKERLLVSALKANEKDIFEYINKKSLVHVSTIHGLLSIYLSQYAEKMKFPPEIKIIDDIKYQRTLKRQINDLLKKDSRYLELLEAYSFLQLVDLASEALNFKAQNNNFNFPQPADLRQIANGKKQQIILAVDQVFSLVPTVPDNWREYFVFLKNAANFLQQKNEAGFFSCIENTPTKPRWSNTKPPFDPLAHALIEDLKDNKFEDLFDSETYIGAHQNLNQLFRQFINELAEIMTLSKRHSGELTIADLENLSLQLLVQHPGTAQDFSVGWDYFMVDEFQDTSPLQVRILNQIICDKPCFIVGDPQQSIYLFRGARSEVFENKHNEMKNKNAEIHFLDTNYRSEPSLMNFINDYFAHFSQQFRPMRVKEQQNENKLLAYDAYFVKCKNQADAVLKQIETLISQGVNPQDICVLSRSNKKLVDIAIKANKVFIPVQLQAAAGFEAKREILDLIAFTSFLNNPHDDENLVTLLRSPWLYVSDIDILNLAQNSVARKYSLWTSLLNSTLSRKSYLSKYLGLFDTVGSVQAIKQFMSDSSFISFSEFYDKTGRREANIFKFLTGLAQAEKASGFSLGLFLDEQFQFLQADLGSSNSEAQPVLQPNCVSLMTVHASKGLQFKHVIVIGFSDAPTLSSTPKITFDDVSAQFSLSVLSENTSRHEASGWSKLIKTEFNKRELLENERVLYVAMTRAIESLTLVAEIDKRTPSEKSWYRKSNWPLQLGEAANQQGYRTISLNYEAAPVARATALDKPLSARNKFSESNQNGMKLDSVTDLISAVDEAAGAANVNTNFNTVLTNFKKAQRGSDLHRVFEALKYLGPDKLVGPLAEQLSEQEQKSVQYLLEQKDLNLQSILKHGHNEWGFGLKIKSGANSKLLRGQIDLWAELENEIHILDYKTGSSDFKYQEKAFEQLAFYTMALYKMKMLSKNKMIIHSVIYPLEGLIKKKTFVNIDEFQKNLSPKIKELFQQTLESP